MIERKLFEMIDMKRINVNRDIKELFSLVSTPNVFVFPSQVKFSNIDDFQHWLSDQLEGYFCELYVITENSNTTNLVIGIALAYDYRAYDRHCLLHLYTTKNIEPKVLSYFIDELFREYPLNKIFWEVIVSNIKYLELANALGFSKEMILKEYKYFGGQYQDVFVFSLYPTNRKKGVVNEMC